MQSWLILYRSNTRFREWGTLFTDPDWLELIYTSGAEIFHLEGDFEPGRPLVILPAVFFS
jgi:hypothetical protein